MKKIALIIAAFILVLVVLPVFLPAQFSMSRSIEINTPVSKVFLNLSDLNEYVKWNPFADGDPTNIADVNGLGLGSSLTWAGEKTGEGKMTIATLEPDQKIGLKMEFYKPMSGDGMVHWIMKSLSDGKTELIWTFDQDLSYFKRYFGLFMDAMMGKHFEKGLADYKNLMESGN